MPLRYFECPDGEKIDIQRCLQRCRLSHFRWGGFDHPEVTGRCMMPTMLAHAGRTFEWDGIPHVTQCINGTIMEFLKHKVDYSVKPEDRTFSIIGTKGHAILEDAARRLGQSEQSEVAVKIRENQGRLDHLEILGWPKGAGGVDAILWDLKCVGSYKVTTALGIEKEMFRDPTGAVYKRAGKYGRPGDPKMIAKYTINLARGDLKNWALQLNRYRQAVELGGVKILKMNIQIAVRDGGIKASTSRGVFHLAYVVPIPFLEDAYLNDYFGQKSELLTNAIERDLMPAGGCSDEECWNGRRCVDYCEVNEWCPFNRKPTMPLRRIGRGKLE